MSLELAHRPDITPLVLKGSNVKPDKETCDTPKKDDRAATPSKRKKLEKSDKLDQLIQSTNELKPILLENQRVEKERNDMFREFISFLKNKQWNANKNNEQKSSVFK